MSKEQITDAQKAAESAALAACQEGKSQMSAQAAEDALKKATDAINKANQKLAKLPEDVIASLQKAIATLMKIVNGWEDVSLAEVDPNKIISQLEALLNPVVDTLCGIISDIGLPEIPGLKQIGDLLAALKAMKPQPKPSGWKKPWPLAKKRPEIPREMKRILQDLLIAIQSLAITLPMVGVNILFNVVDLILGAQIPVVGMSLYDIIGMVPFIKQVPQLVSLVPKIVDLITNLAGKLGMAVEGKIMQLVQNIQDLSIPAIPDDVEVPKELPACPKRDS